jgi:hypothetical protein
LPNFSTKQFISSSEKQGFEMRFILFPALLLTNLLLAGCYHVHSSFQSARILPKGDAEFTPLYETQRFTDDGESDNFGKQYGLMAAYGIDERMNLRFRYQKLKPDGGNGVSYFSVGPKFGSTNGNFALDLPLGTFFGDDIDEDKTFQIHPTVLFTFPVNPMIEINGFAKYLFYLDNDMENAYSLGLGIGIFTPNQRICIRPEYSILRQSDLDGYYSSIGVGLSFRFKD